MAVSFGIHTVVGLHHLHTKGTVMLTIELKQPFFLPLPIVQVLMHEWYLFFYLGLKPSFEQSKSQ